MTQLPILSAQVGTESTEETAAELPPVRRRGALGVLSRGGIALVGGLAGLFATAPPAAADCQGSPCCHLASCTVCSGRCDCFSCGHYKRIWYCSVAARVIGCGECQKYSGDCWHGGTYYCSKYWDDNSCVC
jgi:hypothetical protein